MNLRFGGPARPEDYILQTVLIWCIAWIARPVGTRNKVYLLTCFHSHHAILVNIKMPSLWHLLSLILTLEVWTGYSSSIHKHIYLLLFYNSSTVSALTEDNVNFLEIKTGVANKALDSLTKMSWNTVRTQQVSFTQKNSWLLLTAVFCLFVGLFYFLLTFLTHVTFKHIR